MSNDSVIVLRCACGETYFVAVRHAGSYIKCACGAMLFIADSSQVVNLSPEINTKLKNPAGKRASWKLLFSGFSRQKVTSGARIAFVIGLIMVVSYQLFYTPASKETANVTYTPPSPEATSKPLSSASSHYDYNGANSVPPVYNAPKRAPVSLANGASIAPGQGPRGKKYLIIINETDSDAAVKLVESASEKTRRFVYVRANSRATIRGIAGEDCRLRFATGADWDVESRKFLSDAAYSEFETALNFRRTNYSVRLKPSILGNSPVDSIDEEKFADK